MHITKKRDLYLFLSVVGYANFIVFIAIAAFFGGVGAHAGNGHYYLNEHGRVTEVSYIAYLWIRIHFWVSWLLLLVGVFAMQRRKALDREIGDYNPVTDRTI